MFALPPIPSSLAALLPASLSVLLGAAGMAQAGPQEGEAAIRGTVQRYCVRCHGPDEQKGDVRLDLLDPAMAGRPDAEGWRAALDMINAGEMPPDDEPQPDDDERRRLVRLLTDGLRDAAARLAGERHAVLRRLNKAQYTNTLQDLLGLEIDFGRVLPDDGKSELGFTNNGEVLQVSPLHLDYYQAVARQAVEQAIVVGPRPEPVRYLVTFGRGIGAGKVAGRTGGYQSVPLDTDDFVVEILDAEGRPRAGTDPSQRRALDAVRRRVSVGLRGSSQDRFRVVDEGMILFSAVPHREKVPQAWQGPSPNVKLELQRCFPERGDFVVRVRARAGWIPTAQQQVLVGAEEAAPRVALSPATAAAAAGLRTEPGAIVLAATASDQRENLRLDGDTLRSAEVPEPSKARWRFSIEHDGFYQVDLVHPVVAPDAMPSVRLTIDGRRIDMRPEIGGDDRGRERMVSALGSASLRAGQHTLLVGGPFFVGCSHVAVTPLPDDHPFVRRSTARVEELTAAVAGMQPVIRAFVGTRTDDGMDYKTFAEPQVVDTAAGESATFVFRGRLEDLPIPEPESGDTEVLSGIMLIGLWNDHLVKSRDETGPPLLVESIEVEAPYHPVWPPAAHTAILFESALAAEDEVAYTREVLRRFVGRAFRREARPAEVDRYLGFWREVRAGCDSYEASVREVLVAVLCSPNLLFLAEPAATAAAGADGGDDDGDAAALATRLSYFLWNSPPDATLRQLAAAGELAAALPAQVDRMVADPRAVRFVRAFAHEWLRLDRLDNVTVDVDRFPAFTRFVKRDMAEETWRFVHEVFVADAEIFAFVDSDFAMLNQNLAEFYGVAGVVGPGFRRVAVAPALRRGGLLSQGAFLAGHSDGQWPHPIKRAVWLKEKILGERPPPPPPNVPDLDPNAPEARELTLREQLERHRDHASCRDCHAGIDPYGLAFEGYSAVGLYEARRRGKPIDATTTLPDGTDIDGVDGLKRWLLDARRDQFARAFVGHLFAYALGRDLHFADDEELTRIVEQVKMDGYRARSVLKRIVASPAFSGH